MKISLNWLRELINIPNHLTPVEIGDRLTLHTAELEEIIDTKPLYDLVVAGKLTKIEPHPNSDKLSIGLFDCGENKNRQVLFGQAHEVTVGTVYPIALPGLSIPGGKQVTEAELGGVLSQGMIIDNHELGMKNSGLLTFDESDVGKKLSDIIYGAADQLFDIDNKSLTHRPDLMGHWGFAREVAAIFDLTFENPSSILPLGKEGGSSVQTQSTSPFIKGRTEEGLTTETLTVHIQTPHCRRFTGIKMKNVTVAATPASDTFRLEHLGTKSISNIVDITNLVMLLHGQPMHAFDASKVNGKIIVRQAQAGETLVALDGEEYTLTPDDIVIADEAKILSIAGIMGGLESGVTSETTEIIFESANFDPAVIRKTSARLGLRSESSMRFEKSLDPENCLHGLYEAITRAQIYCPDAEIASNLADNYPQPSRIETIFLNPNKVRRLSGITFSDDEIKTNLTKLGFGVETVKNQQDEIIFEVTVPSIRATKDISIPEDLVEEVVRLYGYGNIASTLPSQPIKSPPVNHLRKLEWQARDMLAADGLREVMHSSFVSSSDLEWLGKEKLVDSSKTVNISLSQRENGRGIHSEKNPSPTLPLKKEGGYITMTNAPTLETTYLRQTLLSNLVRDLENELRTHKNTGFFEIGKTYHAAGFGKYSETKKLALLQANFAKKSDETFFSLKSKLEKLLFHLGEGQLNIEFDPQSPIADSRRPIATLFHPHQAATINVDGQNIGIIGTLHPRKNLVKKSVIVAVELDLEALLERIQNRTDKTYVAPSAFPAVNRDLSIIVPDRLTIAEVQTIARQHGKNLTKIELFDEFSDVEKIGAGKKNLAFHLVFQSKDKTLESDEVEQSFNDIVTALQTDLEVTLRVDF